MCERILCLWHENHISKVHWEKVRRNNGTRTTAIRRITVSVWLVGPRKGPASGTRGYNRSQGSHDETTESFLWSPSISESVTVPSHTHSIPKLTYRPRWIISALAIFAKCCIYQISNGILRFTVRRWRDSCLSDRWIAILQRETTIWYSKLKLVLPF